MSMSRIVDEVLAANRAYSESFGAKGQLGMPPARRFAILTCMDARLDPSKFVGLGEGDAHVIRNAGGRASDDAIRSLVERGQGPTLASSSIGSRSETLMRALSPMCGGFARTRLCRQPSLSTAISTM